jgi:cyclic pyranopterin phosphate synthase
MFFDFRKMPPDPAATPLLDQLGRPVRDLRISLTDRCNLRCTYCMPAEVFDKGHEFLRREQLLRLTELDRIIGAFVRCGVRKLRLTGGEPLLRRGAVKFLRGLGRFPELEDLAMTTNGLLLSDFAHELAEAGLHRVTVSLDALDPAVFGAMNGRGHHPSRVLEGIAAARSAGLGLKVNMVVQRGVNESQILPMARHFKEQGVVLRFIEFMDVGNTNHWEPGLVVPGREILALLAQEFDFEPVEADYPGEVATRYRHKDNGCEFGVITSISAPFCRHCSRARLSADGRLFTCLFASEGFDLVGAMRSGNLDDEGLHRLVSDLWSRRNDRYSELRSASGCVQKVEMSFIGG